MSFAVVGTNAVAGADFARLKCSAATPFPAHAGANVFSQTNLAVNIKPGMTGVGINGTNLKASDPLYNQTLQIVKCDQYYTGSPLAQDLTTSFFANCPVNGGTYAFNGGFATVNYVDGPGLANSYVTLTNIFSNPTLAGDANNDGQVNGADYAVWAANYGANNATWLQGDFNNDGQVNGADYAIWAANYGTGSGTSATPEPISMIILAIGGGLVALKRRNA